MLIYTAPDPVNGDALVEELAAAGYPECFVLLAPNQELQVSGPNATEENEQAIAVVVDAHNGQPTEMQLRARRVTEKIEQRIAQAEAAYVDWANLTQAQKNVALREVVLAVAKIGRHLLSKYDVPED